MNIVSKNLAIRFLMKTFLGFVAMMIVNTTYATSYYIDAISGNDSSGDGSITSPWKTLGKVVSYSQSPKFNAGDTIYFKRGQRFYNFSNGSFTSSGSVDNPITITSYGSGEQPILSTGRRIDNESNSNWTDQGNNIFLYTGYTGSILEYVLIDKFPVKEATSSSLSDGDCFLSPSNGIYVRCPSGTVTDYEIYLVNSPVIFLITDRSYITFSDLTFEFARDAIYGNGDNYPIHHIDINNCLFRYVSKGIALHSKSIASENHDISVTHNVFDNIRFGFICTAYDNVYRHYNLNISNNTVKNVCINGAFALSDIIPDVEALSFQNLHDSIISNNIVSMGVKSSENIKNADNEVLHADGIIVWLHDNATMERVKITNNTVSNVEKGIIIGAGTAYKLTDNLVKGNIVKNCETGLRMNSSDVNDSTWIEYNEFYNNEISMTLYSGARGYQFSDNRSFWPKLYHVQTYQAWQLTDSFFNHNVYIPDGALWYYDPSSTTYTNLAAWQQKDQDLDSVTEWNGKELTVIDGLEIWLKSDTGLLDANGDPVAANGSVQTWKDQSGNNRDYYCTSSSRRPLLEDGISPNGAAGVYFDGTDDAMKLDNVSLASKSIFVVFKAYDSLSSSSSVQTISNQAGEFSFGSCTGLLTDEVFTVTSKDSSSSNCRSGYTSASASISGFNTLSITYNSTSESYDIYLNGTQISNATVGSDDNALYADDLTFHIGSRDLAGGYFKGHIFEYIAYSKECDQEQRQSVESYLTKKYSDTNELPVTANLEIWLKSDAGLLDGDDEPVVANGSVQTWEDQSGNNRDYYCTSSIRRPILEDGISPNGSTGVYFDGIDDAMKLDNVSLTSKSIFVVFKTYAPLSKDSSAQTISNQAGEFSFGSCTGLLTDEVFTVTSKNSSDSNCRSGYTSASANISWFNLLAVVYNSTDKAYDIYLNGVQIRNAKSGVDDNALVSSNLTFHLGSRDLVGGYFDGYIFEYIIYNDSLSVTDRESVENYLVNKYE
jgi:hypothetical protein